jgi:hypothetical protein
MLAALAVPNRAAANPFGLATMDPNSQTVNVGTLSSFEVIYAVHSYATYGLELTIGFDPSLIKIDSVTTGASSPFTNVSTDTINNIGGTFTYDATGSTVLNDTFVVATVDFTPLADGTSPLNFEVINEDIAGYGPFGAENDVDGSVKVVGSAPDVSPTFALLGGALLALAALRRRLACV